jgi:outer membrane murein-binding lipoprotein Lpp
MAIDTSLKKLNRQMIKNSTKKYKAFLCFLLIFIAVFGTGKLWLPSDVKVMNTAAGTEINTSADTSLKLRSWEYSRSNRYMEIVFDVINREDNQELNFSPVAHTDTDKSQALNVAIALQQADTLILQIRDVPQSWNVISLWIQDNQNITGDAADSLKGANFFCDIRKVKVNDSLAPKSGLNYRVQSVNQEISDVNAQLKQLSSKIQGEKSEIDQLNFDIDTLRANQKYQTSEEIENSNSVISNKKSQIQDHKNTIASYQQQVSDCKVKLKKLNQKLKDTVSGKLPAESAPPEISSPEKAASSATSGAETSSVPVTVD